MSYDDTIYIQFEILFGELEEILHDMFDEYCRKVICDPVFENLEKIKKLFDGCYAKLQNTKNKGE